MKENESSNNTSSSVATSVQQNLPQEAQGSNGGDNASASNDRREETTNYELSSKTVNTVSNGFSIENLSVAVVVNKARLDGGDSSVPQDKIDEKLKDIQQLVATAADLHPDRGDQIKVLAVDFSEAANDLQPEPSVGIVELLVRQSGTYVNAAAILLVACLVIWFGLRPATRAILGRSTAEEGESAARLPRPDDLLADEDAEPAELTQAPEASLIEDLTSQIKRSPRKRLEQMVRFSDEHSAAILKQWMHQGSRP